MNSAPSAHTIAHFFTTETLFIGASYDIVHVGVCVWRGGGSSSPMYDARYAPLVMNIAAAAVRAGLCLSEGCWSCWPPPVRELLELVLVSTCRRAVGAGLHLSESCWSWSPPVGELLELQFSTNRRAIMCTITIKSAPLMQLV
jgi:hypothetical protein